MFEHIILRRARDGLPISAGQIAEALLYYQKTHLFIDNGTLIKLVQQVGLSRTLDLLCRADLSAVYCEETLGTSTDSFPVAQYHKYVAITLAGNQGIGQLKSPHERIQHELELQGIKKRDAKHFSKEFLERVPIRKFTGNHFLEGGITRAAKHDLLDKEYLGQAIRMVIARTSLGYEVGDNLEIEVIDTDLGMVIFTNIDWESINRKRSQSIPPTEPLTIGHILTNILDARADLALSSFYGGDFVTSAINSSMIQLRHSELLRRSNLNTSSRQQFTEIILPDCPSLAEVIDSQERSFDEFLTLIDRAERFKGWLKAVNPDEDLIQTYMRDISAKGWIERLPAKSLRYALTLALDATNPLIGIASGIIDNFVIERLASGWRPNHFVSGKLSPFINGH